MLNISNTVNKIKINMKTKFKILLAVVDNFVYDNINVSHIPFNVYLYSLFTFFFSYSYFL